MSGRFRRKSGEVVAIRINPRDVLSVLDMAAALGVDRQTTLPQMVSNVLAGLLEMARRNTIIPEPDMFQYLNRVEPILRLSGRKVAYDAVADLPPLKAEALNSPVVPAITSPTPMGSEQRAAVARLKELDFKKEYAADSWSTADQLEYDGLMRTIYG